MDSLIAKLISFLIENIYVVVVVLGILYTIFFRTSPIEKRPPNRMPDFGGGSPLGIPKRTARQQQGPVTGPVARPDGPSRSAGGQPEDVPKREHTPTERPQRENFPASEGTSFERPQSETYAASPRTYVAPDRGGAGFTGFEEPSTSGDNGSRLTGANALSPARDELARAIVWAEVLGPPRAKKPFRR